MTAIILLPIIIAVAGAFSDPNTPYKPRPAEVEEVKGVYKLDDGTVLKVYEQRRRLYAQLGAEVASELVPVAENRYVSADQRMKIEFEPQPFGGQVTLTFPAGSAAAGGGTVTAPLASR